LRRCPAGVLLAVLLAGCSQPSDTKSVPETPAARSPATGTAPEGPPARAVELTGPPRLVKVGEFDQPTFVASPPGDKRIFVVEQKGRVVEMVGGRAKLPAFIDITGQVDYGTGRGLFSIAFAPNYAESGLAYLSYTNLAGDSRIDEYKVDASNRDRLDPGSRREILAVDQPYDNNKGGLIRFDPTGMLMAGFGDGGGEGDPGNSAQGLKGMLGKLIRIDPSKPSAGREYGIPEDNPFVHRPDDRAPEIWAYGLRNPWGWSFDPQTKGLYVADAGQSSLQEINFVPPAEQPGANFGWSRYEGDQLFDVETNIYESQLVRPIKTYGHTGRNCAVIGGGVYQGRVAELRGFYLYADFCGGVVMGFKVENGRAVEAQTFGRLNAPSISSFGEDSEGEMYLTSQQGGVYRITAN